MVAQELTEVVMDDLRGRKGVLDDVEQDIQEDIQAELKEKIETKLAELHERGMIA